MNARRIVKPLRRRPEDWSHRERFHYAADLLGMEDREFGEFLRREGLCEAPVATWLAVARERGLGRRTVVPEPRRDPPSPAADPTANPADYQRHVLRRELKEARDELDDLGEWLRR